MPRQAVPQQEEVFGDDNAHGISMVTAVGPPGGLPTARTPSKGASRRSIPRMPVPRSGVGAAVPVVGDADPQHPVGVPDVDPGLPGFGVLGYVSQQLADREVGGRLDRGRRRRPCQVADQVDPYRGVQGQGPDRVGQAAVGQHRRVDAANQVA